MSTTYYEVLGVPRTATAAEIRAAYLRLSRQLHPDLSSRAVDSSKFQEVNLAWTTLRDPQRRVQYDAELATAQQVPRSEETVSEPSGYEDEWGAPISEKEDEQVHADDWGHIVDDAPPPAPPPPTWQPMQWEPGPAPVPLRHVPSGRAPRATLIMWGLFYGVIAALAVLSAISSPSQIIGNMIFYALVAAWAVWAARIRVRHLRVPKRYVLFVLAMAAMGYAMTMALQTAWSRVVMGGCWAAWLTCYLVGTERFVRSRRARLGLGGSHTG